MPYQDEVSKDISIFSAASSAFAVVDTHKGASAHRGRASLSLSLSQSTSTNAGQFTFPSGVKIALLATGDEGIDADLPSPCSASACDRYQLSYTDADERGDDVGDDGGSAGWDDAVSGRGLPRDVTRVIRVHTGSRSTTHFASLSPPTSSNSGLFT